MKLTIMINSLQFIYKNLYVNSIEDGLTKLEKPVAPREQIVS
jgi:hypothetical protein